MPGPDTSYRAELETLWIELVTYVSTSSLVYLAAAAVLLALD